MSLNLIQYLILLLGMVFLVVGIVAYRRRNKTVAAANHVSEAALAGILEKRVAFYQKLEEADKLLFRQRVQKFLQQVRITPIKHAAVRKTDRVLVAAAGIIPLFRFKNWMYRNLDEVLLYPETFDYDFSLEANYRPIAGMVGDGAMHRTMILSLPYLRAGFENDSEQNTAIHEFIHLLDKSDGATDGIPGTLLEDRNMRPWIHQMSLELHQLRKGDSSIDPYGAKNEAEFFAVASEFFFQEPEKLQESHPELFALMEQTFGTPKE